MKLTEFRLLTDENIAPQAVVFLRDQGFDVWDVKEAGFAATDDVALLVRAVAENRIILTQDSDFGTAFFQLGFQPTGIVYLRPGHVRATETIALLTSLLNQDKVALVSKGRWSFLQLSSTLTKQRVKNLILIRRNRFCRRPHLVTKG
jgi:predicted nuclease of predicted toxin-antitoxin system